jgi:hypothetical protein
MATVRPIKPEKAVDPVRFEPVMVAVRTARACAWLLEETAESTDGELYSSLIDAIEGRPHIAGSAHEILEQLRVIATNELHAALYAIEREYREMRASGRLD